MIMPVYVAWTLWSWVSARIGVARPAMYMVLTPLVSGVTAWLLLGEEFSPLKLVGAAVVLSGLVLARRGNWSWSQWRAKLSPTPSNAV
jgi:drug/metabolite transporter (DMT)-like permease